MDVIAERIAVAEPAGIVDPLDVLVGRFRESFANFEAGVLPFEYAVDPPRPCWRLPADQYLPVYSLLFANGAAVPVRTDDVDHKADGTFLSGGLFTVKHKESTDRFIFDRRPQNFGEARLGWACLP